MAKQAVFLPGTLPLKLSQSGLESEEEGGVVRDLLQSDLPKALNGLQLLRGFQQLIFKRGCQLGA